MCQVTVGYWEYGRHFPKGKILEKLQLLFELKPERVQNSEIALFKRLCQHFSKMYELPIIGVLIDKIIDGRR